MTQPMDPSLLRKPRVGIPAPQQIPASPPPSATPAADAFSSVFGTPQQQAAQAAAANPTATSGLRQLPAGTQAGTNGRFNFAPPATIAQTSANATPIPGTPGTGGNTDTRAPIAPAPNLGTTPTGLTAVPRTTDYTNPATGLTIPGALNVRTSSDLQANDETGAAPAQWAGQADAGLANAISNTTMIDELRTEGAGLQAQQQLGQTAQWTAGVGNTAYTNAELDAAEALARGDSGLQTAEIQGANAQGTARAVTNPMYALAATDQANAGAARTASTTNLTAANTRLSASDAEVARLQALAATGDPAATAQLAAFQGSAGTAGALAGLDTTTAANARLGAFGGSAGTAGELDRFNPNIAATGQLGAFTGNNGTAGALTALPTTVGSTAKLGAFTGNAGNAPALENLNTGVSATGNLLGFQGNNGTANDLKNLQTGVSATGDLAHFQGEGGVGLDELETLARGPEGPSAAEALLQKKSDMDEGQALALARSGRGAGASASNLRQAIFENAATGQQTASDLAALRAQEAATAKGQKITAATAAAGTRAALSGQKLTATTAEQQGQLQAESDRLQALVQSGNMTQAQAAQQLDAFKSAQTGQLQSVAQKSTNLATAGEQRQTQAAQQLDALKTQQAGELQSVTTHLNALVAAGQMTQAQANMQLDALKAKQEGEVAASGQRLTAITASGQQLQVQSAQQLDALKAQQVAQTQAVQQKLDALVASGQMTQKQADQQLTALQATQQGELAAQTNRINAATAAGSTANTAAGVSADIGKALATIGLQYDVNSGQVLDQAGNIVQGGDKIAADLLGTGLTNQAQQGANAANTVQTGTQALTQLTQTSADAQKAVAILGPTIAAQVATLDQGQLVQLQQIVQSHNAEELEQWAATNNLSLANAQQTGQTIGAVMGALATLGAGLAILSDVRAKTDFSPMSAGDWMASNGLNAPAAAPAAPGLSMADKFRIIGMAGNAGSALGAGVGGIASDKKGKKDKRPETFEEWLSTMPDDAPADFRAAKGYSYQYKDPSRPGAAPGRQFGPMAQSLQHTAAKDAVFKGPDGMLAVDPRRVVMPLMSAVSEQQRRLDSLEDFIRHGR